MIYSIYSSLRLDFFPLLSLFLLFASLLIFLKKRGKSAPTLSFSMVFVLSQGKGGFRLSLLRAKKGLFLLSLFLLALALTNIRLEGGGQEKYELPTGGGSFVFLIDRSSSMKEGLGEERKKIDLVKDVTVRWLEKRPSDLLALFSFARKASIICPLTLDHQRLKKEILQIEPVTKKEEDGTSLGYALFKTVNMLVSTKHFAQKAAYTIRRSSIVLLTDGLESPNPADVHHPYRFMPLKQSLQFAEQNGVQVYMIAMIEGVKQARYRQLMQATIEGVKKTGGDVFVVDRIGELDKVFSQLDAIPKEGLVKVPQNAYDLSSICVLFSLLAFSLALLLETLFVREVP